MTGFCIGERSPAGVEIDGRFFSWLWLRDHSQDVSSYHHAGRQRLIEAFDLADLDSPTIDVRDGFISFVWNDGSTATYTADYLAALGTPTAIYASRAVQAEPWDALEATTRGQRLSFGSFSESDATLRIALHQLGTDGFVFLDEVPLDRSATRIALERIGYVRKTTFGELWNLRSDGEFDDTGSTDLDISPHTDATYSNDAPGFLGLHCLEFEASGGNSVLVDGFQLATVIRGIDPLAYDTLASVDIPGRYIGDGAHLVARRPLFRHESGDLVQVSYNNHDRAPFWLPRDEMAELYRALTVFNAVLREPEHHFEFGLRPGTMVIFDNWRVLHGRRSFAGNRHVIGGYLNREDYESTLRRLHSQPLDMVGLLRN